MPEKCELLTGGGKLSEFVLQHYSLRPTECTILIMFLVKKAFCILI